MNTALTESVRPRASVPRVPVLQALAAKDFGRDVLRRALRVAGEEQEALFAMAREQRARHFPAHEVEVRSVIEISNVCGQQCEYCGMGTPDSQKYLISYEEFLEVTGHLYAAGRRVLLLQAGENLAQAFVDHVSRCLRAAKSRYPDLVFILCFGNLNFEQYRQLREAGGERYVLKYETSNARLYEKLKPRDTLAERVACLEHLLALGFKVGSGNIVGLPGQTMDDMVEDIVFAGRFALSMLSCSVFIPGEGSKLHKAPVGDVNIALNTMAVLRLMYPGRLIPTTSPLEKVRKDGQYTGLMAGANTVTIHDGTPPELKKLFPIYSGRRFTPNVEHIRTIVKRAGLSLGNGPLV